MSNKICVWQLGDACGGKTEEITLFKGQISTVVCEKHFKEHKIIMGLFQSGYDIDKVMQEKAVWREEEFDKLVKDGKIDPDKIEF